MSLFPDRQLVSSNSQELVAISTGLTDLQKKQLSQTIESYLKENRLIGYENTRAILPVIRLCIENGLQASQNRDQVLPQDNLTLIFNVGYKDRLDFIKAVETEIKDLPGDLLYEGDLAISRNLILNTQKELKSKATLPKFKYAQEVSDLVSLRRPIFRNLLKYCREKVEEEIPGSKNTKLTPKQNAGLVRHLIFSWVTMGKPSLLLETEDFMNFKDTFLSEIGSENSSLWQSFAQLVEQPSPAAIDYFKDLSKQIAEILTQLPNQSKRDDSVLSKAASIDKAFKVLEPQFLVLNPFNKIDLLSENPEDKGKSIWDENRSIILKINSEVYRIPKSETLNLAAYLLTGRDPNKAIDYREASKSVTGLFAELERQESDATLITLNDEIKTQTQDIENLKQAVLNGITLPDLSIPQADILKLVKEQQRILFDEMQFLPTVRLHQQHYIKLALEMAQDYLGGKPLDEKDFKNLQELQYSPGILRGNIQRYLRNRIGIRIKELELLEIYRNFNDLIIYQSNPDHRKSQFYQALNMTVIDTFTVRNDYWFNQSLIPEVKVEPNLLPIVWTTILKTEIASIEEKAKRGAWRIFFDDMSQGAIENIIPRILNSQFNKLGIQFTYLQQLYTQLNQGKIPDDKVLLKTYLNKLQNREARLIENSISIWSSEISVISSLNEQLKQEDPTKWKAHQIEILREETKKPNGVLQILLTALVKLAPEELYDYEPVRLEEVAHQVRKSDLHYYNALSDTEDKNDFYEKNQRSKSRFYGWLKDNGIPVEEKLFDHLISYSTINSFLSIAQYYHQLYSIEDQLHSWYSNLAERLHNQTSNSKLEFYQTNPALIIERMERELEVKIKRYDRIKKMNAERLSYRLQALQDTGLIQVESK